MKKLTLTDGIGFVVWLLPAAYLLMLYPSLPDTVPVHFGADGQPDRYGDRSEFLLIVLMLMGVSAIMYLLLKFLPSIDPKRTAKYSKPVFRQLAFVLLLFMSVLNLVIMYATTHGSLKVEKLVFPLLGVLFTYLGNIMHSLKPNYFVGIRTPWTLESENTWRKTHQLAGKIWLPGGLIITLLSLLLPTETAVVVFMITVFVMIIIPVIYSYLYYKKHSVQQP